MKHHYSLIQDYLLQRSTLYPHPLDSFIYVLGMIFCNRLHIIRQLHTTSLYIVAD
jgi:hypothetical protein